MDRRRYSSRDIFNTMFRVSDSTPWSVQLPACPWGHQTSTRHRHRLKPVTHPHPHPQPCHPSPPLWPSPPPTPTPRPPSLLSMKQAETEIIHPPPLTYLPAPHPISSIGSEKTSLRNRAEELCESVGGRPGFPVPNKPTVSVDVKQLFNQPCETVQS